MRRVSEGTDVMLCCRPSSYKQPEVLHGASTLLHADAEACFFLAGKLGTRDITDDEERSIQTELKTALALEQGTPVAVGSGKSALRYKLRATAHSTKLTCKSWRRVAEELSCTATWVGDLGEMGITRVKGDLRQIMGEWIVRADENAEDADADDDFGEVGEEAM